MKRLTSTLTKLAAAALLTVVAFFATSTDAQAVVNGDDAGKNEGWMVAVAFADETNGYNAQFCGGTLVAEQFVLTAAHCLTGLTAADIDVIVGRYNLSTNAGERIAVEEIIRHPAFDDITLNNDVAILKLVAKVNAPVVTLSAAQSASATVFGWGETEAGYGAEKLQQAELVMGDSAVCAKSFSDQGNLFSGKMLCAAGTQTDACNGDSGGPLMAQDASGASVQIGIVSWGAGCGQTGSFGVYTNVAEFIDWINLTVQFM